MSNLPPAGWYPDPDGAAVQRWWDGSAWGEHVHPPPPRPDEPAPARPAIRQVHTSTARSLADHAVADLRRTEWPEDGCGPVFQLMDDGPAHRAAVRAAVDALVAALAPGEHPVFVHIQASRTYQHRRRSAWATATATALTPVRAVGAQAAEGISGPAPEQGVEVDAAPLARVDVDRQVLAGFDHLSLLWRPGKRFRAASRSSSTLAPVKAFLASPSPQPFPQLVEQLGRPLLDAGAPPPDWYPDPWRAKGQHRWWDGFRWTADTAFRGHEVAYDGGGGDFDYGDGGWD